MTEGRAPRPETSLQRAAREKRAKISELKFQNRTWDDIGEIMGLEGETCRKYFEKGLRRGEYGAPADYGKHDRTSIMAKAPALAGDLAAQVAGNVDLEDEKFAGVRAALREANCPPKFINGFMKRLKTTLAVAVSEGRRLSLKETTEELERKIAMNLQFMDETAMSGASLKDLSINLSVLIEKHQLLLQRPTQIIDFTSRQQLQVLLPRMVAEAQRRGITLDGTAQRVEAP